MTTRPRFRFLRRMTREAWHEQRKAGFVRWTFRHTFLFGGPLGLVGVLVQHLDKNGFAPSSAWLALFFSECVMYLPMYLLTALTTFSLLWLHYEEDFFHTPANEGEDR